MVRRGDAQGAKKVDDGMLEFFVLPKFLGLTTDVPMQCPCSMYVHENKCSVRQDRTGEEC